MPSILTVAAGASLLLTGAQAQYALDITYDASNFFSTWDFFSEHDPTNGFVEYLNADAAAAAGLANTDDGAIFMGVDSTTENPSNGRQSVRLSSQQSFTHGLIITDIAHMPGSICGAWPAFWSVGPDWPNQGEIDILEGVNTQKTDSITLHSSAGLTITNDGSDPSTELVGDDCQGNNGCGQTTANEENYGDGFNAIGGGVYATEWASDHISVWFFPRSGIPSDIDGETPDPSSWGNPVAKFNGPIDTYFKNHQLVFDTTFCGDWAGNQDVWNSFDECAAAAPTCQEYVAQNPAAFQEAYWSVNYVKVFSDAGSDGNSTSKVARAYSA